MVILRVGVGVGVGSGGAGPVGWALEPGPVGSKAVGERHEPGWCTTRARCRQSGIGAGEPREPYPLVTRCFTTGPPTGWDDGVPRRGYRGVLVASSRRRRSSRSARRACLSRRFSSTDLPFFRVFPSLMIHLLVKDKLSDRIRVADMRDKPATPPSKVHNVKSDEVATPHGSVTPAGADAARSVAFGGASMPTASGHHEPLQATTNRFRPPRTASGHHEPLQVGKRRGSMPAAAGLRLRGCADQERTPRCRPVRGGDDDPTHRGGGRAAHGRAP